MRAYRIYVVDGQGLRVTSSDFTCEDDAAATSLASSMVAGRARAEVWQATRLIETVWAGTSPAPGPAV